MNNARPFSQKHNVRTQETDNFKLLWGESAVAQHSDHRQELTRLEGGLYYVYSTDYDAANRLVQQKRGGSNNLLMQLSYFAWETPNGNGRLKQIKVGTVASPTSLLDLRYCTGAITPEYDALGNIKHTYNYAYGGSQTRQRKILNSD